MAKSSPSSPALDRIAQMLGLDRALVRERNLVPAAAMPYTTPLKSRSGSAIAYDTGDPPKSMNNILESIEYKTFTQRQHAARASGRYLGIGIASGMKTTGRCPYESALVQVGRTGRVAVFMGAMPMGQASRPRWRKYAPSSLAWLPICSRPQSRMRSNPSACESTRPDPAAAAAGADRSGEQKSLSAGVPPHEPGADAG